MNSAPHTHSHTQEQPRPIPNTTETREEEKTETPKLSNWQQLVVSINNPISPWEDLLNRAYSGAITAGCFYGMHWCSQRFMEVRAARKLSKLNQGMTPRVAE